MGKHAIIVIKNDRNEYLQYFDEKWNSYLFLNCKLEENFNEEIIKKYVSEKLKINEEDIKSEYIGKKTHTKFSESAKINKEYEHYFFKVNTKLYNDDTYFYIDNIKYGWYSYNELENDKRIQEVNSDIVGFIKEYNL